MKSLHTDVVTEIDLSQKRPRVLFECYLDNLTLTYVADRINIVFPFGDVTTYTALAIQLDDMEQTIEGQINRVNVSFDNTAKYMGAYAASYEFEGKQLIIKRVYLNTSGNAPSGSTIYNELFNGTFEAPKDVNRSWFQISATAGKPLRRKVLLKNYNRECNHVAGDTNCNRDNLFDLTTLKITGGGVSSGSATTLNSSTAFSQTTSYWNHGVIEIGISGTTYKRKVKEYSWSPSGLTGQITFDVTLPLSVAAGSVFQVKKGCDKRWDTCGASYAYGPSADNTLNFYGFQHIGTKRETG